LHVFGHALTKRGHGKLLSEMECAASSASMFTQKSSGRKEGQATMGSTDRLRPRAESPVITYRVAV
ncbi:MAG TPA: hypothetical protein VFD30_04185, partial [Terriglobia bacterium]|nr:hypothetical protein [Terriglobia bacterium]